MVKRKHIIAIILCLFSLCLYSQSKDHLSKSLKIEAQEASLKELLEQVSKQCSCYFSYPSDLFNDENKIITQAFVGNVKDFIVHFMGDSIEYHNFKNQIILNNHSKLELVENEKPDNFHLSATILDSITQHPIPNASIRINSTMQGTSANANGIFSIHISPILTNKSITISCLGYHSKTLFFNDLKNKKTIYLSPASISLQEVMVRSIDSRYILENAIENLKSKYRRSSYGYAAFYREIAYRNKEQLSYSEALFDAFSPRSNGIRKDDLALKKARKFSTKPSLRDSIILKLKGGTEAAQYLDIAQYPTDFLSAKGSAVYRYQISDIQSWKDQWVYILHFSPLGNNSEAEFEGELYISFEDFILLGAEFEYATAYIKENRYSLILKKDRHTKAKPERYLYRVEYQLLDGLYHLNYIRGDITIKAKQTKNWRYKSFNTIFEMVVTNIDLTKKHRDKSQQRYKTNSIFSETIEFSPEAFWRNDNIILPEQEIMEAFYTSGFMMEEEK